MAINPFYFFNCFFFFLAPKFYTVLCDSSLLTHPLITVLYAITYFPPGMWFLKRRVTISSGKSIRKHTAFSVRDATSVKTWRMSTWSPESWTMWEREKEHTNMHSILLLSHSSLKRKTFSTHAFLMAVSPCCSCSPGSSSQKRILMTAWPSLYLGHPPLWRHNTRQHPSPRSSLKT